MSRLSPLPLHLLLLGLLVVVAPACGKRGPPLPPLRMLPDRVTDVSVVRRAEDVTIRFTTPAQNVDGSEPLRFDHVEIYALTVVAGGLPPTLKKVFVPKNRVGEMGHASAAGRAGAAGRGGDAAGSALTAPVSLTFVEKVAMDTTQPPIALTPLPIVLTRLPVPAAPTGATAPAGTALALSVTLPVSTRFYLMVTYANRTRVGATSDVLGVPLGRVPEAPRDAALSYEEQTLTLAWVANAAGLSYHVYNANPPVSDLAKPLTATPLTTLQFTQPVAFGTRSCFAVRSVSTDGPVSRESAPSNTVCVTPADTFPPPVPAGLIAFATEGSVSLTWDAVTAGDLAGYLVLRGEGTGERLQPLTVGPVTGTAFTDTTARAGVRYVYAVVAVDNAMPANRSKESNRVEETGRQR